MISKSVLATLLLNMRLPTCKLAWSSHRNKTTAEQSILMNKDERFLNELKPGGEIEGFSVNEVEDVSEYNMRVATLSHNSTKARYIHVFRNDWNNVFSIGFRTTPIDSRGVPHILEHVVLCGSQRYPCRDPFFHMLNRSTATFMNAMTGPDYTIYPFSTQNPKDYINLMSVYLDAVFKPLLKKSDFEQEGWRIEGEDVNDPNSPLSFKGIVFNEMKGVFCNNQSMFGEELLNSILPGHTYSHVSGGHPLEIPQLTYECLKEFHCKYYHPKNSRIYSYGNFTLTDKLRYINEVVLRPMASKIDDCDLDTSVPKQKRWKMRKTRRIHCRYDPMAPDPEKQSSIGISYLCSDIRDIQETFEFYVLEELLVKGPNSPFYRNLVESHLCSGFAPQTGFDAQTRDTTFTVALQGVNPKDFDQILKVYDSTIEEVINNGFEAHRVEAVLHQLELGMKHQSAEFGLHLLFQLTPLWNHDGDIIQFLRVNDRINTLKNNLRNNPKYLQDKVKQYLSSKGHGLVLSMTPVSNYEQENYEKEKRLLQDKVSRLSTTDRKEIFNVNQRLRKMQEAEPNVSCLPTVDLFDIPSKIPLTPLYELKFGGVPMQISIQPTNHITYLRLLSSINDLNEDLKLYVPLFTRVFSHMSTRNFNYRDLDLALRLHTGGFSATCHLAEDTQNTHYYEEGILFQSSCLDRKTDDMMRLWTELFNNNLFDDEQRFQTLIRDSLNYMINSITEFGHVYAMSRAAAGLTSAARRREQTSGLSFMLFLKDMCKLPHMADVRMLMEDIAEHVLNRNNLRCAVNMCEESEPNVVNTIKPFILALPGEPKNQKTYVKSQVDWTGRSYKHYVFQLPVNYVAKCILAVPFENPQYAPLCVLMNYLTRKYLHVYVREKGGAYSSAAKIDSSGILSMYSYRDPNSLRTFDIFDDCYNWFRQNPPDARHLNEAKLKVFQKLDAPLPPSEKGIRGFLYGITDLKLQKHREAILAVDLEQLSEVAKIYLRKDPKVPSLKCLIGPENDELYKREGHLWSVTDPELRHVSELEV